MLENNDSYYIEPGKKIQRVAGPYDIKTHKPQYSIEVNYPSHVKNQVEQKTFIIENSRNYFWAWKVVNNSNWPIFVTVKRDGIVIPSNKKKSQ
ncbi:MAG: hypothetical protein PF551_04695 [Candidatus Marinimicrobia bacterium]|jgi:CRISPR/Cas system CMR-associated protein Cmr1 (group 7 of RAMP superfamily)|nr:hypothetical protein [Candidatus Neomarinimicrobiota bacterium]